MHGTVKVNYRGCACLAQHGKNKNKQAIRKFFQSRCRNGLPPMVEPVQKELEHLIYPRRPVHRGHMSTTATLKVNFA